MMDNQDIIDNNSTIIYNINSTVEDNNRSEVRLDDEKISRIDKRHVKNTMKWFVGLNFINNSFHTIIRENIQNLVGWDTLYAFYMQDQLRNQQLKKATMNQLIIAFKMKFPAIPNESNPLFKPIMILKEKFLLPKPGEYVDQLVEDEFSKPEGDRKLDIRLFLLLFRPYFPKMANLVSIPVFARKFNARVWSIDNLIVYQSDLLNFHPFTGGYGVSIDPLYPKSYAITIENASFIQIAIRLRTLFRTASNYIEQQYNINMKHISSNCFDSCIVKVFDDWCDAINQFSNEIDYILSRKEIMQHGDNILPNDTTRLPCI